MTQGHSRTLALAIAGAMRSVLFIGILTGGALYSLDARFDPPHGSPLVYAIAVSWLIAITVALLTSAIFKVSPRLFYLARWEKEGKIYDRAGIRSFRWLLLHSPFVWINPSLYLSAGRADCERLLREMNASEGVHWVTCLLSSFLAISYVVRDYAVYGYVMLMVRIPFDLYPIMLQRRIRGRLYRVLNRQVRTSGG